MVAIIAAVPPVLTVVVAAWAVKNKLDAIHTLANSRLTDALREIVKLNRSIARTTLRSRRRKKA